jgi:NAD(P)-dependent dehydrogenase (short-subunit alcohol dehydrogenase family)
MKVIRPSVHGSKKISRNSPFWPRGFEEALVAKSLLKRRGTPGEVAWAARFLLLEDSNNITGTELIIDGGVRLT